MPGDRLPTAPELADGWSARLQALIDSGAEPAEIAALMFESAMVMGAMALELHPAAENFLTGRTEQRLPDGTSRFVGHTVRWLHGKGPDQHIAEQEAEIECLQVIVETVTGERSEARQALKWERERCERLERERNDALLEGTRTADKHERESRAGAALLGLVEQVIRLRRNPCPTMGFGFEPTDIASAVESEVAEVRVETPGSREARVETAGVLATALHLVLVHGSDPVEAIEGETEKLRRRLDVVEAGGTWTEAKALERAGGESC